VITNTVGSILGSWLPHPNLDLTLFLERTSAIRMNFLLSADEIQYAAGGAVAYGDVALNVPIGVNGYCYDRYTFDNWRSSTVPSNYPTLP
jgi:hypothetical protein